MRKNSGLVLIMHMTFNLIFPYQASVDIRYVLNLFHTSLVQVLAPRLIFDLHVPNLDLVQNLSKFGITSCPSTF
jgi:hypothetical protein